MEDCINVKVLVTRRNSYIFVEENNKDMDNYQAEVLAESNRRLIEAYGMYSENLQALQNGIAIPYRDEAFFDLANQPFNF